MDPSLRSCSRSEQTQRGDLRWIDFFFFFFFLVLVLRVQEVSITFHLGGSRPRRSSIDCAIDGFAMATSTAWARYGSGRRSPWRPADFPGFWLVAAIRPCRRGTNCWSRLPPPGWRRRFVEPQWKSPPSLVPLGSRDRYPILPNQRKRKATAAAGKIDVFRNVQMFFFRDSAGWKRFGSSPSWFRVLFLLLRKRQSSSLLPSFTEFYRVLPSFTEVKLVFPSSFGSASFFFPPFCLNNSEIFIFWPNLPSFT